LIAIILIINKLNNIMNKSYIIKLTLLVIILTSCEKPIENSYWNDGKEFIELYEEFEIYNGSIKNGWGGYIMVAKDGTVLTDRRSEDGGKNWGDPIPHLKGPGRVLDEKTGDILNLDSGGHERKPEPFLYRSKDNGKTWQKENIILHEDVNGWQPILINCEEGITLRYGEHKGRLLLPARVFVEYAPPNELYEQHYSSAIYSDDGGKTWFSSAPFPVAGTGEAALVELSDGRIYYNSRNHNRMGNRDIAWSYDGGETWQDHKIDKYLPDGPPDFYGNKGGLVRLEIDDYDILIYSMTDDPGGSPDRHSTAGRNNITVWASFDGGETWPVKRWVHKNGGYSHLAAGRPGTPSEGMIYLTTGDLYARFNLAWITEGRDWRDFINK
jgi:sialidase-1